MYIPDDTDRFGFSRKVLLIFRKNSLRENAVLPAVQRMTFSIDKSDPEKTVSGSAMRVAKSSGLLRCARNDGSFREIFFWILRRINSRRMTSRELREKFLGSEYPEKSNIFRGFWNDIGQHSQIFFAKSGFFARNLV